MMRSNRRSFKMYFFFSNKKETSLKFLALILLCYYLVDITLNSRIFKSIALHYLHNQHYHQILFDTNGEFKIIFPFKAYLRHKYCIKAHFSFNSMDYYDFSYAGRSYRKPKITIPQKQIVGLLNEDSNNHQLYSINVTAYRKVEDGKLIILEKSYNNYSGHTHTGEIYNLDKPEEFSYTKSIDCFTLNFGNYLFYLTGSGFNAKDFNLTLSIQPSYSILK
ncbi:MAG: hypothetical protein Q4B71_06255 [Cardiobacteriaceae bacterium]|nr:hypothetical protein [Cardiobacteriaceae bacterium]